MITIIGVLAILFATTMFFLSGTISSNSPLATFTNRKRLSTIFVLGLALVVFDASFFIARESKQYYVLNKATGERDAQMTPGLHLITPFVTEVREWDKYLEIKGVKVDDEGNLFVSDKESEALRNVEGVIRGGVSVRFIDKVTASVYGSE